MVSRMPDAFAGQMRQGAFSSTKMPPIMPPGLSEHEFARRMRDFEVWLANDHRLGPEKPTLRDRRALIFQYEYTREHEAENAPGPGEVNTRTTFIGFERYSSKAPLEQLERISFADMMVRKVHKGKYLLCRTLSLGVRQVGCQFPVEDPAGDSHDLALYNYPTTECAPHPDLDALFPIGTIMAIREPTFKKATQGPFPMIRVDSPSDLILLRGGHPLLEGIEWRTGTKVARELTTPVTIDGWRTLGNAHFKAGRWLPAAIAYTAGLSSDTEAHVLRLNRSEAYLRLSYFAAALKDAEDALRCLDPANVSSQKALLRVAKALYGLGKYTDAESKLLELQRETPDGKEVVQWLDRIGARILESKDKTYDWCRLFLKAKETPRVDACDYVGSVEVAAMEERGGGRGVRANRHIQPGELLVVAKPFVSVFPQDLPPTEEVFSMDMLTKKMNKHTQTVLISRVIRRMIGNPEQLDAVTSLYAGPNHPKPPSSYPPPTRTTPVLMDPTTPVVDIDAVQVEGICSCNSFSPGSIHMDAPGMPEEEQDTPSALYLFPSLFNHACLSNAAWVCFGDLMVIRATEPIASGEEITLPYCGAEHLFSDREKYLEGHLTECQCALCKMDRDDGPAARRRREDMLKTAMSVDVTSNNALARLRSLEKDIATSYRSPRSLHPAFWKVPHRIALALEYKASRGDLSILVQSIEEQMRVLSLVGVVIRDKSAKGPVPKKPKHKLPIAVDRIPGGVAVDVPSLAMLTIAHRFVSLGDEWRAMRWLKAAMWVQNTAIGGGKELFELRFKAYMERHGLKSLFMRVMMMTAFGI